MPSKYIDTTSCVQVIGTIFQNPSLLDVTDKYQITDEDFTEDLHKVVMGAIYKIHETGVNTITIENINDYLNTKPKSNAIYAANKGDEWLKNVIAQAIPTAFDFYYNRMKKMSLLRAYDKCGIDVSWIYDPNQLDTKKLQMQEEQLENMSLLQISDKVDAVIDKIRQEYSGNDYSEESQAGEGIDDLIARLQTYPEVGVPLYGRFVNRITRGARLKKLYLRSGATGLGKAIPNDTLIPTPEGMRKVGDIKVGDYLFGQDGKPTKVLAVYPQPEDKEIWKVTFKSGRVAECCNEHLWGYYATPHGHRLQVKPLEEIYREGQRNHFKRFNHYCYRVPIAEPVELPAKQYRIEPYIFGLILGDGSFRYNKTNKAFEYSSEDKNLPNEIAERLNFSLKRDKANPYCWYFKHKGKQSHTSVWVEELLKDYPQLWNCDSHKKFIPKEYLFGSIEQRMELLRGLMDTDGGFTYSNGRVSFTTVSPQLKTDFMALLSSLGMLFYLYEEHKTDGRIAYHIDLLIDNSKKEQVFHLKRKKQLARQFLKSHSDNQRGDRKTDPIVNIEKTAQKTSMTCFTVDNTNHLFIAGETWWVTHNTRTMIADICSIGTDMIYDDMLGWIGNGVAEPCLFIATEQDLEEVQTMMLAFIAHVNEEHILSNSYLGDELDRVVKAAQIIKESPIYVNTIPDFSIQDIEDCIKRNIREYDVHYCFFDYIHSSMKILEEISRRSGGVKLREDNVLFMLSVKLKDMCNKYGVFIETGTQLNGQYVESETPDQNLLRGAKSIADLTSL